MKLITTKSKLTRQFIQLCKKYKNIAFATAWATSQHPAFQKLLEPEILSKIQQSTIGLHFYQTEPAVLRHFKKNSKQIKFLKQTNGVFHPKTYLFWNDENDYAVLIGSANFTKGAFDGKNIESTVLIESNEDNDDFFNQIFAFLKNCFDDAANLSQREIDNYENLYKLRHKEQQILANEYGKKSVQKSILSADILNYSWKEYYQKIQKDKYHGFDVRLQILKDVNQIFMQYPDFNQIDLAIRQFIAGTKGENSGWFGSTVGNGKFVNAINTNSEILAQAINQIPLIGEISAHDFFDYIEIYQSIPQLVNKPNALATATRLLSMKRPDLFVCLNEQNRKRICAELGIKNAQNINAERYWFEILQRFYDTAWFNSKKPKNNKELSAWYGRIALLDCIYYTPKK